MIGAIALMSLSAGVLAILDERLRGIVLEFKTKYLEEV